MFQLLIKEMDCLDVLRLPVPCPVLFSSTQYLYCPQNVPGVEEMYGLQVRLYFLCLFLKQSFTVNYDGK